MHHVCSSLTALLWDALIGCSPAQRPIPTGASIESCHIVSTGIFPCTDLAMGCQSDLTGYPTCM